MDKKENFCNAPYNLMKSILDVLELTAFLKIRFY